MVPRCVVQVALAISILHLSSCGPAVPPGHEVPCTPHERSCNGAYLIQCNANGDRWVELRYCDGGCQNGVCIQAGASCPEDQDCTGLECGPDPVCGSICGICGDGQTCEDGVCVQAGASCPEDQDCTGLECGPDPVCGISCGTCGDGQTCQAGTCVENGTGCSVCNPGLIDCNADGDVVQCDADGCAWTVIETCPADEPCSDGTCGAGGLAACGLPWGDTIAHGETVTAYEAPTVPCGEVCESETLQCDDGVLSGSFSEQNCEPEPQVCTSSEPAQCDENDDVVECSVDGCRWIVVAACANGCSDGVCDVICDPGLIDCDGVCVDTDTDRQHCGACNEACPYAQACQAGSCSYEWNELHTLTANALAAGDMTGNGEDDLVAATSSGVHYIGAANNWVQLTTSSSITAMTFADVTGDGNRYLTGSNDSGTYYWDGSEFQELSSVAANALTSGDVTGDGQDNLVAATSIGVYYLDAAHDWLQLTTSTSVTAMTFADATGDGNPNLIASNSSGTYYWENDDWEHWSSSIMANALTSGDMTGDGQDNVVAAYASGIFFRDGSGNLITLTTSSTVVAMTFADVTGDGTRNLVASDSAGTWYLE